MVLFVSYILGEPFNVFLFYMHRLLRTTPTLAATILFQVSFFEHMGDGPIWKSVLVKSVVPNCEKNWWSSLLYINNYYKLSERVCLSNMHLKCRFQKCRHL